MPFGIDQATIAAYFQVVTINLVLSGDNVIVIGMAAAGLPAALRQKAIMAGIAAAAVIRIAFAIAAAQLLAITGIMVLGGLLLLYVCWKMYQELRDARHGDAADDEAGMHVNADGMATVGGAPPVKLLRHAVTQIIIADVSMSLDNVLAVAGAAKTNMNALVFGLVLSVVLMGVASSLVAKLLAKYRWIAWGGLAIIFYVAVRMIYEGAEQIEAIDLHALTAQWFG
jgi:YjbE family integral membrane protein